MILIIHCISKDGGIQKTNWDPEDQPHVLIVEPGQRLWWLTGLWWKHKANHRVLDFAGYRNWNYSKAMVEALCLSRG